ncbi:MAG: hypothetical protein WDM77_20815 [Steroidobacteraceae bacterium]
MTVPVHRRQVQGGGVRRQQGARDARMAFPQRLDLDLVALVLALGQQHQPQQRIGHAAARREDDPEAPLRLGLEDVGHALEAGRVRHARAAEFMHDPAVNGLGMGRRSAA